MLLQKFSFIVLYAAEMRLDMYPRIDVLRISVILTDMDSSFLVWMDTDTDTLSWIFYRHTLRLYFISCFIFTFILCCQH